MHTAPLQPHTQKNNNTSSQNIVFQKRYFPFISKPFLFYTFWYVWRKVRLESALNYAFSGQKLKIFSDKGTLPPCNPCTQKHYFKSEYCVSKPLPSSDLKNLLVHNLFWTVMGI